MKYIEEIRQITEKAEKDMRQEQKIIKYLKRKIKRLAKQRYHSAKIWIDIDDNYNTKYIVDYFRNEGFETDIEVTYDSQYKITCVW